MRNIEYINAGAGSGKTHTLTEKLAKLIHDKKTTPSRVILTTFTIKAADEFRVKAREMLLEAGLHERASEMDSASIGTVHSVAYSYVRKYWYLLGLSADVQPMEDEDTQRFMAETLPAAATQEDIRSFHNYADKIDYRAAMSSRVNYDFWRDDIKTLVEKAETFNVDDLSESLEQSIALLDDLYPKAERNEDEYRVMRDIIERMFRIAGEWKDLYKNHKKENNLVSFNDMEHHFITLLGMEEVRRDIAESIDYVFVDEFQDSNPTQVRIFDMLSDIVGKQSFWVGDPKQAIYDFRGCDTALVSAITSEIEERTKNGEDGFSYSILPFSYRSDPALVDLVNKVFTPVFSSELTKDKVVLTPKRTSALPAGTKNILHWNLIPEGRSTRAELVCLAIARQVRDILCGEHDIRQVVDKETKKLRDIRPGDIAVLCKTNDDCEKVSDSLRSQGLKVVRSLDAMNGRAEIALMVALLNFMLDDSKLLDAEISHMLDGRSVNSLLECNAIREESEMISVLCQLRERLKDMPVAYIVDSLIRELDLAGRVCKWGDAELRQNALESIRLQASSYEKRCLKTRSAATLGGFIRELESGTVAINGNLTSDGVNVLTYHASKGLEWNVVILASLAKTNIDLNKMLKKNYIGVNEIRLNPPTRGNLYSKFVVRYIPRYTSSANSNLYDSHKDVLINRKDFEQIRTSARNQMARLLYVGATRARDYLITTAAKIDKMKWLKHLDILDDKIVNEPKFGPFKVWGINAPDSYVDMISSELIPAELEEERYYVLNRVEASAKHKDKYVSPSRIEADNHDDIAAFRRVFPAAGASSERIEIVGKLADYSVLGTCVHNIFAGYRPGRNEDNVHMAARTISAFGLESHLVNPESVIRSLDRLYDYLERTYGRPSEIMRETPFAFLDKQEGTVVNGEIDLIWDTPQGSVIVDYKNYPGFDDVTSPESAFYAGKYLPQMKAYSKAVTMSGRKVMDVLIYYSVQCHIIRVDMQD